ncbi:hypothetical protein Tco_1358796 [Tanacetum coccineum]
MYGSGHSNVNEGNNMSTRMNSMLSSDAITSLEYPSLDRQYVGDGHGAGSQTQYTPIGQPAPNRTAGASTKDHPIFCSNFCPLVTEPVFDCVNISIPHKVVKKVKYELKRIMMNNKGFFFFKFDSWVGLEAVLEGGPWLIFFEEDEAHLVDVVIVGILLLMGRVLPKIPFVLSINKGRPVLLLLILQMLLLLLYDGFQTVGKKKKKKGKSKVTNGGQFVGPSVKQNVRYELKATTSTQIKGTTNVGDAQKKGATAGFSSKNDNIFTSNSYSALNVVEEDEDEVVENVYDEMANLFTNTQSGGSSSFTVVAS